MIDGRRRRTLLKGFGGAVGAAALPAALVGCGGDDDAAPTGGTAAGRRRSGPSRSAPTPPTRCQEGATRRCSPAFKSQDRRRREGQHGRPQHVPGADQPLPAGHARTTSSCGSPATACSSSPSQGLAADISDVWEQDRRQLLRRAQERVHRRGRQAVLRAVLLLPVGGLPPEERLRGERLRGPEDARRVQRRSARQMKKRRPVPIAFADKDGWPAMGTFDILNMRINGYDFHVQPDGGRGVVAGPEGQAGLRHLARAAAATTRRARSAAPGRRPRRRSSTRRPGMYLLGMFVGQQFPEADREDLDFFAFPEIDSSIGAGHASTRRSTASCSRKKPEERGRARRRCSSTSARPRPRTSTWQRPEQHRRQRRADTSALQRAAEEGRRAGRRRAEHHAVPGPRHPAGLRLAR